MPTARTKANRKYNEKAYDRLAITVVKGEKETIQDFAAKQGQSLNSYVNDAIKEKIERDKQKASE